MKTRQDNNAVHHTSALYTKNDTKLTWTIVSGAVSDENHIEKWCDQSYQCALRFHDIDLLWLIGSSSDSEEIQIRQLVIDLADAIYSENKTELLWLIGTSPIYEKKNRQDNYVTDHIGWSTSKLKLNCQDISDRVRSMMKTK